MILAFSLSFFAFTLAFRLAERLMAQNFFNWSELTKIGTAYLVLVVTGLIFLPSSRFNLWVACFIPQVISCVLLALWLQRRSRNFESRIRELLSVIALKMRSGKSFRQSFTEATAESDPFIRTKLTEIMRAVVFSQQRSQVINGIHTSDFVRELTNELIEIDQHSHSASRRLSVLRDKLRIEDDFRRRSGQVLSRIRAQSLVMSGLYFALFIFMCWRFGFERNIQSLICSMLLFSAGSTWIWLGGRNLQWKV